jgi:hypothetical protein
MTAKEHITTVKEDFYGEFVASCSCGWSSDGHDTKVLALGAGDRHIASKIH